MINLPADLYDTLELHALANDGIGGGRDIVKNEGETICHCAHGPTADLRIMDSDKRVLSTATRERDSEYALPYGRCHERHFNVDLWLDEHINRFRNDMAIMEINKKKGIGVAYQALSSLPKVTWEEYVNHLGIVRVPNPWEGIEFNIDNKYIEAR